MFNGSFVENDLQLRGSYESSPPCRQSLSTFGRETMAVYVLFLLVLQSKPTQKGNPPREGGVEPRGDGSLLIKVKTDSVYTKGDILKWSHSTLQHIATHCNILQRTATYCNVLQHTKHTATHCNTLQQHAAPHYTTGDILGEFHNTLKHTATHCNTLQHTATTRYNTLHCR